MSFEKKRKKLIENLRARGILTQEKVADAISAVPREQFIPDDVKSQAYIDSPLAIGSDQTISAPHMNVMMCQILELEEGDKLLEVGTGSGYHAALCAEIIAPESSDNPGHVYTIERHENLAEKARKNLKKAGYEDIITVVVGDGTLGYEQEAPYDKILVTAASPSEIPPPLMEQLKEGGILCIPAGSKKFSQALYKITKEEGKIKKKRITGVRFVPLLGKYGF
jgi:protein-L-isoaspartate(D-aspartate) O-methyltransferase